MTDSECFGAGPRDTAESPELSHRQALTESEARFQSLFESSPIGMAVVGLDGHWLRVNPAVTTITGHSAAELATRDLASITHPADLQADLDHRGRLLAGEIDSYQFEKRYLRADGSTVHCLLSVTLLRDEQGRPVHFLSQIVDVDAERRHRDLLEAMFCASPDPLVLLSVDGSVVRANEAWERTLGRKPPTIRDTGLLRLVHPDDRAAAVSAITTLGDETAGRGEELVTRIRAGEGGYRWLKWRVNPLPDRCLFAVTARDITVEMRAAEDAQRRAARETARLRATITAQRELTIAATDRRRLLDKVVELTAAAFAGDCEVIVGLAAGGSLRAVAVTAGLVSLSGAELGSPSSLTGVAYRTAATVRSDDTDRGSKADRDLHRAAGIASMMAAPLFAGDQVIGTVTVTCARTGAFDETDEQQLTLLANAISGALRNADSATELAERAQLLDLTRDAVIVGTLDDRIRFWNPAAERIYGWPAEIAAGRELGKLLGTVWPPGTDQETITAVLARDGFWEGELEHTRIDGRRLTIHSRMALQRDAEGRPAAILSINADVSARRAAEKALQASEQRVRSQFVHSSVGQMIRGVDDRIEDVNPAFAAMLGYHRDEMIGMPAARLYDPAKANARSAALASMVTGEIDAINAEGHLVRADGTMIDVHMNIAAVRGADGRPERFAGVFQDITARKIAETQRDAANHALAEQNSQLERANQLKQDLIGMIGHEINNPLTVILGHSSTTLETWDRLSADQRRQGIATIDRNARRLEAVVHEVLTLVTHEAGHLTARPEPVELRDRLTHTIDNTGIGSGVALHCPRDAVALVQPVHLDQIITNLLSNAAKYGGGATAVRVSGHERMLHIDVEDRGPGVPAAFREHLFERFARDPETAGHATGIGLGLFIVREIARANGGDIVYRSRPGGGSIFTVALPRAGRPAAGEPARHTGGGLPENHGSAGASGQPRPGRSGAGG